MFEIELFLLTKPYLYLTELCYNQTGDISTLEGTPLKLVDKFTYLGSSVESTENDIETRLMKAWTAINRLSIIWKSDLTDKMKPSFFQAVVTSILLYGCTTWTLTKMEQILLVYGIPKETVVAITILYRNTKVKVRSPDGDTEYFDIVAGVLQGDTLAPYLFIICLDYVLRTSIDKIRENGFELTKKRSRRYPATTITDADYADDIAILANTPDQAETLLHSLEWAAAGIGLYVNAHKTEYMCYNQTGDISTLEGTLLN